MELVLAATVEIAVPPAATFAQLRDFRGIAERARARGIRVRRVDPQAGERLRWDIVAQLAGRRRPFALALVGAVPGRRLDFALRARHLTAGSRLEVTPADGGGSRVAVTVRVVPRTRLARLAMRSLRLGGRSLQRRFAREVAARLAPLEARWRSGAATGGAATGDGAAGGADA